MKNFKFYFNCIFVAIVFITLFFMPISAVSLNLLDLDAPAPEIFSPFGAIVKTITGAKIASELKLFPFCLCFYALILLPCISIYFIVSLFLKNKKRRRGAFNYIFHCVVSS